GEDDARGDGACILEERRDALDLGGEVAGIDEQGGPRASPDLRARAAGPGPAVRAYRAALRAEDDGGRHREGAAGEDEDAVGDLGGAGPRIGGGDHARGAPRPRRRGTLRALEGTADRVLAPREDRHAIADEQRIEVERQQRADAFPGPG